MLIIGALASFFEAFIDIFARSLVGNQAISGLAGTLIRAERILTNGPAPVSSSGALINVHACVADVLIPLKKIFLY